MILKWQIYQFQRVEPQDAANRAKAPSFVKSGADGHGVLLRIAGF